MKAMRAVKFGPTSPPRSMPTGSGARHGFWQWSHQNSGRVCCSTVSGHLGNIDLLSDSFDGPVGPHGTAAVGAGIERMREKAGDLFDREGIARVHRVAGLAADGALLAFRRGGRFRFDDVGGWRLGRGRGTLLGSRQLFEEKLNLGFECYHSSRQHLAVRTGFGSWIHTPLITRSWPK